ncbi:MAG: C-terminal binding protein [Candidatus Omnitrophica bacterium]|nr:C-terminal binding protein [Candidatus Omnitrophota bacterium]
MNRKHAKFRVLIPDHIDSPAEIEEQVFGPAAEVIAPKAEFIEEIPEDIWSSCDAILAYDCMRYEKPLLSRLSKCRVIVRAGIGTDNIDLEEARKRDISVCNVPDYCTEEVADHTMAFLLALVRGFPEHAEKVCLGRWERKSELTFRLRGKVFGIIGLGRIGSAVAVRAKALGLKVVFYDPYIRPGYDKVLDAERLDSLEEVAYRGDIISIHTPLTEKTRAMIGPDFFSKVKKGAFLINTARGPIVDITALEQAMKEGLIRACGLDVLSKEPPDDKLQLIKDFRNGAEWLSGRVIITPHSAYHSHEALDEVRLKSAAEAKRVLEGKRPLNCVNLKAQEK